MNEYLLTKGMPQELIRECVNKLRNDFGEEGLKIANESYKKIYEECIRTLLHSPTRSLTKLSGPSGFFFYKNIHSKRILLTGEYHDIKGICKGALYFERGEYEIHDWLFGLGEISDVCLDVFVEEPFRVDPLAVVFTPWKKNRSLFEYKYPSEAIIRKLGDNGSRSIRYHYSDTRELKTFYKDPMLLHVFIKLNPTKINVKYREEYTKLLFAVDTRRILSVIVGLDTTEESFHYYYNIIASFFKSVNLASTFNKTWEEYVSKKIQKRIEKLDPDIDPKRFLETMIDVYMDENTPGDAMVLARMDVYLLTRLFTKFSLHKKGKGTRLHKSICDEYVNIKYAIIHTGYAHTEFYVKFFERFFGNKPDISIPKMGHNQCLRFTHPFDYFEK